MDEVVPAVIEKHDASFRPTLWNRIGAHFLYCHAAVWLATAGAWKYAYDNVGPFGGVTPQAVLCVYMTMVFLAMTPFSLIFGFKIRWLPGWLLPPIAIALPWLAAPALPWFYLGLCAAGILSVLTLLALPYYTGSTVPKQLGCGKPTH